jgi:O-antigen ligase
VVGGVALFAMITIFPEEVSSRFAVYSETLSPDSPASELVFRSRDYPLKNFLLAFEHPLWPTGYGIGTASLGIQYVTRIMHAPPMRIGVENGFGQLIIELGIMGLLLWIFLAIAISISTWRIAKSLRGTSWFPISFAIFWYAFLLLLPKGYISFVSYQDYLMNAYLWILLGILYRLPDLAQKTALSESAAPVISDPGRA